MNRSLYSVVAVLKKFREFVGNVDVPAQHIQLFLYVAERGGKEVPLADLIKLVGTDQSAVSRAVAKLGPGVNPREPGYGLLTFYEDPEYRRRKLVDLTPRGKALLGDLEKIVTR